MAENVLVEVLARADSEKESARQHRRSGRGCLGDDRRMDAHGRARDARSDADSLGTGGDPAEDAPHERAVPLPVDPGMEVIRDESEAEARLLRAYRVPHEIEGRVLLARDGIAKLHVRLLPVQARRTAAEGGGRGVRYRPRRSQPRRPANVACATRDNARSPRD